MKPIKEIWREHDLFTKHRTKCKCGCSMLITSRDGKKLCPRCKHYVFATPEIERKYRQIEFEKTMKRKMEEK